MAADSGENAASACMTACACRLLLATQVGVLDPACVEACASAAWAIAYTGVAKARVMAIARKDFIGSIHQKGIATVLGWRRTGNDLIRKASTK